MTRRVKEWKEHAERSLKRRHIAREQAELPPPDDVLTIREASRWLKLSERQTWQLCKEGKLPAAKIGNSWRLFRHEIMSSELLRAIQQED